MQHPDCNQGRACRPACPCAEAASATWRHLRNRLETAAWIVIGAAILLLYAFLAIFCFAS